MKCNVQFYFACFLKNFIMLSHHVVGVSCFSSVLTVNDFSTIVGRLL